MKPCYFFTCIAFDSYVWQSRVGDEIAFFSSPLRSGLHLAYPENVVCIWRIKHKHI